MNIERFKAYNSRALSTVYSEPDEGFHAQLIPDMVKQFMTPLNLPKHSYILDIGCGGGLFMTLAKDLDYTNVIGVTLSPEDAKVANDKGHSIVEADMSDLPFGDKSVDFIWCRHAIEHSPYPLFTLYEFSRVLKDDGYMYLEVPAPDCDRIHEANPNHYSVLGERMWLSLLAKSGFEVKLANTVQFMLQIGDRAVPEKNIIYVVKKNGTAEQGRTEAAN